MFESFDDFINEAGMNDPVLMAFRAAKMKREKELAKPKRKPLYGKQREKAEEALWVISQDLKDLYADRGQLLIDMEQEAEVEGGPVADRYGEQLDMIEDKIASLIKQRNKLEMRLAESVDFNGTLNEGTRGQFGKIYKNGEIRSVYTHYDSYPENMLPIIKKAYKKGNIDDIISKGDNSGLEAKIDKMNFYGGPNDMNPMKGKKSNIKSYIKKADQEGGAEFIYLYDESDKKWYMVDVYGDGELVPAFESVVSESKVQLKRRYTENHPAITAGKFAKVRNKMLEAIGDGKITQEEFDSILKELSSDSKRWSQMNKKYFSISEDGISLSVFGKRILNQITINENMDTFIFESFSDFVNAYNNEPLFEAEVEMDALDPDNKDFLKFLKKNRVKIIAKTMQGPAANHPVITMQGKRKDLETVLADCNYGWCDEELAEYIEESVVSEARVLLDTTEPDNANLLRFIKKHKITMKDTGVRAGGDFAEYEYIGKRKDLEAMISNFWGDDELLDYIEESTVTEAMFSVKDLKKPGLIWWYNKKGDKAQVTKIDKIDNLNFPRSKDAPKDFDTSWGMGTLDDWIEKTGEKNPKVGEVYDINESTVNEAFKSSKLRNLLNMDHGHTSYGKQIHGLAQAFYSLTKAKLDQIGDEQLIDYPDPKQAAKEFKKNKDAVVFYISDNHKENPYADRSAYNDTIRPGIIGVSRGSDFLGAHYTGSGKRLGKNKAKAEYHMSVSKESAIGGNKKYKGYEASGLYTVKRVADVADRAIVINLALIKDTELDARQKVADRAKAKEGAIAFQSAEEFKKAQRKRYEGILATKASKLPLDKMVEDAIETLTKHISDAMKKGDKTKYNEIKIGEDKRGREIKLTDASNVMSSILGDYERYVRYTSDAKKEKDSGFSSGFYEKEAKAYAKKVSDRVKDVKNMNYAW